MDALTYALVLAKQEGSLGPQLHHADWEPADAGAIPPRRQPGETLRCVLYMIPPGTLLFPNQTMDDFAYALTRTLGRAVRDRTGLVGTFDADAQFNPEGLPDWAPNSPGSPNSDMPSFFSSLQEQLGLKLESTRGPVEMLVIDHVEHPTKD